MTNPSQRAVAVIGGGPAGLIAAYVLAEAGHKVTIVERMPTVGRKLLIAGRGGLNLTHSEPLETFLTRYREARSWLAPIVSRFHPKDLIQLAESLGQETFVGTSGRVFPKAMKASPLLRAWLQRLSGLGVTILTRHRWIGVDASGAVVVERPDGSRLEMAADAVVLALGGASWPRLGSDGQWQEIVAGWGVAIAPMHAANCGIQVDWSPAFATRHAGAALKRIALTCGEARVRGEALITSRGLEGGAVYAIGPVVRSTIEREGTAALTLDLRPDSTHDELVRRFSRPRGKQSMATWLRKVASLSPPAIGLLREASSGALPTDPATLARLVKALPLRATGLEGLDRAISTAGGIRADEIGPDMMLKRKPGVFVAGEMLDWEAPTGGYLLQACFATGAAAGRGVLAYLDRTGEQESA